MHPFTRWQLVRSLNEYILLVEGELDKYWSSFEEAAKQLPSYRAFMSDLPNLETEVSDYIFTALCSKKQG